MSSTDEKREREREDGMWSRSTTLCIVLAEAKRPPFSFKPASRQSICGLLEKQAQKHQTLSTFLIPHSDLWFILLPSRSLKKPSVHHSCWDFKSLWWQEVTTSWLRERTLPFDTHPNGSSQPLELQPMYLIWSNRAHSDDKGDELHSVRTALKGKERRRAALLSISLCERRFPILRPLILSHMVGSSDDRRALAEWTSDN